MRSGQVTHKSRFSKFKTGRDSKEEIDLDKQDSGFLDVNPATSNLTKSFGDITRAHGKDETQKFDDED